MPMLLTNPHFDGDSYLAGGGKLTESHNTGQGEALLGSRRRNGAQHSECW
jgi:hypothetical protein